MSKLIIYGTPLSRTLRTLWMAGELGIDYESMPLDFRKGETDNDDYRRINPMGRIPSIQDGDFVLWESMAINLYLAKKYPGPLSPKTMEEEALATQWSIWAALELETPLVHILQHRILFPENKRDEAVALRAAETVKAPLGVLEATLDGRDWIVGDTVSVTDINVAGIMTAARRLEYDLTPWPNVDEWLTRCMARPAAVAAREMAAAAMAG